MKASAAGRLHCDCGPMGTAAGTACLLDFGVEVLGPFFRGCLGLVFLREIRMGAHSVHGLRSSFRLAAASSASAVLLTFRRFTRDCPHPCSLCALVKSATRSKKLSTSQRALALRCMTCGA